MRGFDVPFAFDALAVCVQDHGAAPAGVSHLDFRHNLFKARLEAYPYPHTLLYKSDEVPEVMNRLTSVVRDAARLPADTVAERCQVSGKLHVRVPGLLPDGRRRVHG